MVSSKDFLKKHGLEGLVAARAHIQTNVATWVRLGDKGDALSQAQRAEVARKVLSRYPRDCGYGYGTRAVGIYGIRRAAGKKERAVSALAEDTLLKGWMVELAHPRDGYPLSGQVIPLYQLLDRPALSGMNELSDALSVAA